MIDSIDSCLQKYVFEKIERALLMKTIVYCWNSSFSVPFCQALLKDPDFVENVWVWELDILLKVFFELHR